MRLEQPLRINITTCTILIPRIIVSHPSFDLSRTMPAPDWLTVRHPGHPDALGHGGIRLGPPDLPERRPGRVPLRRGHDGGDAEARDTEHD